MATARYKSRAEYVIAIRELHQRAQRSGWDLRTASRDQITRWLHIGRLRMEELNRVYGITIDDIRTGRL